VRVPYELSSSRVRPRLLQVFIVVLAVVLSLAAADYVLYASWVDWAYAMCALLALVIVFAIINNWRKGVYLFLTWLLLEDFARKYLGNNLAIYFVKDILALVVLVSFIGASRRQTIERFRPPFWIPLVLFMWLGAFQVLNPASTHIMYGLMGFKLFFFYVPFVFIGYSMANSEEELRSFFRANLFLIMLIVGLGIAQAIIGPTFLNPARPAEDLRELSTLYRVAPQSHVFAYRPTSVFVSAGRYMNFIMLAWLMVLGFTGYLLLRQKRDRLFAFLVLAITGSGAFLSASRGTFAWSLINASIVAAMFLWGAPWRNGEVRRVFRVIQRVALGVTFGMVLLFMAYPEAVTSRFAIYEESLSPSSPTNELVHRGWNYPVQNFLDAFRNDGWLWGYGIGTTGLGGQYVARIFHVRPPVYGVESGWGTLVVEMGIAGLILWLILTVSILRHAWRVVRLLKGSPWFPLAFVFFWYAFMIFIPLTYGGMAGYEDFLLNAYLWLCLGLLFRLPKIALSSQYTLASTQ
jgi:hypothetical protein